MKILDLLWPSPNLCGQLCPWYLSLRLLHLFLAPPRASSLRRKLVASPISGQHVMAASVAHSGSLPAIHQLQNGWGDAVSSWLPLDAIPLGQVEFG